MKFTKGDRVRLRCDSQYWGQSKNTDGTIYEMQEGWWRVQWDCGYRDAYDAYEDHDLELVCRALLLHPDMELEEIEQAQALMEELK